MMRPTALGYFLTVIVLSTSPAAAAEFAWQRVDQYVPPDFAGYFPDDPEAGKRLDDLLSGRASSVSAEEYLEAVRQGLRRATKFRSQILDRVGQAYIWRRPSDDSPQNPLALELMYHATGSEEFRDDALYYGLQVARNKTDNILRALMEYSYEERSRTIWGIQQYDDVQQVVAELRLLLDKHETLPERTVLTAYDVYQGITGQAPPKAERFADVGQFIVFVADRAAPLVASQPLDEVRTPFLEETSLGDRLIDFTRRLHRGEVHLVAVVRGAPARDRLADQLASSDRYRLVGIQLLTTVNCQHMHLPELARYLPDGAVRDAPSWSAQVETAGRDYTWNRTDGYAPPAFQTFFPDDPAGGKALDRLYEERDTTELSESEMLDVVRRGLRRTTVRPNMLMGWFCYRFIAWPQNPEAVEILYHALGADPTAFGNDSILYNAVYFGFRSFSEKTDNMLHALADVYLQAQETDRREILGLLDSEHEKVFVAARWLETLDKVGERPDSQIVAAYDGYHQLTGKEPPNPERFAEVGRFVMIFMLDEGFPVARATQFLRQSLQNEKHWLYDLAQESETEPGEHLFYLLVEGIGERDVLIRVMQQSDPDGFELVAAAPLSKEWSKQAAKEGLPEFGDFLAE